MCWTQVMVVCVCMLACISLIIFFALDMLYMLA